MTWDLIVLGAGVAGLAAAQEARYYDLKVLLLEQLAAGGEAMNIPLLDSIPGIPPLSGADFIERQEKQCQELGVDFDYEKVKEIHCDDGIFTLLSSGTQWQARQVIISTGTRAVQADIPGAAELRGRGLSDCAGCDAPFFRGMPVAVLGSNDFAYTDALHLAKTSSRVFLIHDREPSARAFLIKEVNRRDNVELIHNSRILQLSSLDSPYGFKVLGGIHLDNGRELPARALFVQIGHLPNFPPVLPQAPDLGPGGGILTDALMQTSIPGLFAAGSVREQDLALIPTSVADGMRAARQAYNNKLREPRSGRQAQGKSGLLESDPPSRGSK